MCTISREHCFTAIATLRLESVFVILGYILVSGEFSATKTCAWLFMGSENYNFQMLMKQC